jgi:HEPN domain-containing protein
MQGRYNESITISNLALEIFIHELLREVLRTKFEYDHDLKQALKKVREEKLHETMRKNFFAGKSHNELIHKNDIYNKFDEARRYRGQVMHYGKVLDKLAAEKNINNIFEVNRYLIQNVSTFAGDVLKRACMV